jgi:uncharacterized protein YidB (DUF937 family)
MGLLDILNGMQHGPRGSAAPGGSGGKSGMSPMTMAILGLLAYKAVKHLGGSQQGNNPAASPGTANSGPAGGAGGLGDLLKGGLGGLLAGGAAGSVISGGLGDLLRQFQDSGHGDAASSWVSRGPNQPISPNDLGRALGADQLDMLSSQTGLSRNELLEGLSHNLPGVIDQLTPHGRLPGPDEVSV